MQAKTCYKMEIVLQGSCYHQSAKNASMYYWSHSKYSPKKRLEFFSENWFLHHNKQHWTGFLCQRKHFLLLLWVHKNPKEQFKFCKYAAGLQKNCQWKICGTLPEDLLTSTLMLDSLVKLEKLTEIFFNTFRLWFDYHWPNVMI